MVPNQKIIRLENSKKAGKLELLSVTASYYNVGAFITLN